MNQAECSMMSKICSDWAKRIEAMKDIEDREPICRDIKHFAATIMRSA